MSATVSVAQQNHVALSMYPIGMDRWKPMSMVEPDAHVGIGDISFAHEHWVEGGVGANNALEKTLE
eukprot:1619654-Ditylum_brightwellii.AAC.1